MASACSRFERLTIQKPPGSAGGWLAQLMLRWSRCVRRRTRSRLPQSSRRSKQRARRRLNAWGADRTEGGSRDHTRCAGAMPKPPRGCTEL